MWYKIEPDECYRTIDNAEADVAEFDADFVSLGDAVVDGESTFSRDHPLIEPVARLATLVFTDLIDQACFAAKDNARLVLENARAAVGAFVRADEAMSSATIVQSHVAFGQYELAVRNLGAPEYDE
ncbi:MAG: hypothetical protein ACK5KO_00205 [Arachnia sp.]